MKLFLSLIIFCAVSLAQSKNEPERFIRLSPLPLELKIERDSLIASRLGEARLKKYFVFDSTASGLFSADRSTLSKLSVGNWAYLSHPHYVVNYKFRLPEAPWHSVGLWWGYDSLGRLQKTPGEVKLPDCISGADSCSDGLDSLEAIAIAKANGLRSTSPIQAYIEAWLPSVDRGIYWTVVGSTDPHLEEIYLIDFFTKKVKYKTGIEMLY